MDWIAGSSLKIRTALDFATEAHRGQKRKYTGENYITHPIAVAKILCSVENHDEDMLVAALLHDTVEDTSVTIETVRAEFGQTVAELVGWLTDTSKPSDGNRAARKAIDRLHSAAAPAAAQTIKLADLIDNTLTIEAHDPGFAKVYREEKRLLLDVMTAGDPVLWEIARQQVDASQEARQ
jgi:(p)ppGpp synthase/HD superfamily hydrolase